MADSFTENNALSELGITDFSEITSENFIRFTSVFDKLDTQCQLKALEAVPSFIDLVRGALSSYKETLDRSFSCNSESMNSYYSECHEIISGLKAFLVKDNLGLEEKKYVMECMMQIERNMAAKDSENKEYLKHESEKTRSGIRFILAVLALFGLSALGATIGANHISKRRM